MMIVLGLLLGLIIILQIFILIGTCRKNYKLDIIDAEVYKLCNLMTTDIGPNTIYLTHIIEQTKDINAAMLSKKKHKKKHKKKKGENFYADNEPVS